MDFVRLIFAGLFFFIAMMATVLLVGELVPADDWGILAKFLFIVVGSVGMLVLTIVTLLLFNSRFKLPENHESGEEHINRLREEGLLLSEDVTATRAFEVEEFEDEGMHYFVELGDGRVLFLTGQDLYYYQEIDDDPEFNQPRQFPCTEFTLHRHKSEGDVVNMECRGTAFEPEWVASHFTGEEYESGLWPEEGGIVEGMTYDEVKKQFETWRNG